MLRGAAPGLVGLALAACADRAVAPPDTEIIPAEVRWLEWSSQITSAAGESLRVIVYAPCGTARLQLVTEANQLRVVAEEERRRDGSCIGTGTGNVDTTLPLPPLLLREPPGLGLDAPVTVFAPFRNGVTGGVAEGFAGTLMVSLRPILPGLHHVVGRAFLTGDPASGCLWAALEGAPDEVLATTRPPQGILPAQPVSGLLRGFRAGPDPACGSAAGVHLLFLQLDLGP